MISVSYLKHILKSSNSNHSFSSTLLYQCLTLSRSASSKFFSTTRTQSANRNAPPGRGTKTLKIVKKSPVRDKGKPPEIGERKSSRKKIVLSNSNALDVKLPDLDSKIICKLIAKPISESLQNSHTELSDSRKFMTRNRKFSKDNEVHVSRREPERESIANVVGLSNDTIDSLRAMEAFKITQSWNLFRRPSILIREESKILTDRLLQAQKQKTTMRMVIDGAKGSGKSMMLLHAMAVAFINNWVVIHIPEAKDVTNAVTEYAPIPGSDLFCQNTLSTELLGKIAKANSKVLSGIRVKQKHATLSSSLESNCSIHRLCELGAREPELAWPFFLAFWSEITSEESPPIMMCLDGVSHILQNSLYLKPDLSYIHSHDLAIVRHFTDHLSGVKTVPNGGAFLAATNRSHAPTSPTLELAVKRSEEREQNVQESPHDPFEKKYDFRSDKMLTNVEILKLGGLNKNETRSLLEYWAKSGILRSTIDEKTVAEKWVLAGAGNPGEIQRGSLWMRL